MESSTLPDEPLAGIDGEDDAFDVTFEDEQPITLEKRPTEARGQNEPAEGEDVAADDDDGSDPDLSEIKDAAARAKVMDERRIVRQRQTEFLAREERVYGQLLNSELKNAAVQRDSAKMALDGVDLRIRTALEALKAAKIDDDKGAEVELDAQVRELTRVRGEIQAMASQIPRDDDLKGRFQQFRAQRNKEVLSQGGDSAAVQPQSDLAGKWARTNNWLNNPKFSVETQAVITMSNQLAAEGYDINGNDHYVELSKRMARKFPSLSIKDMHGRALSGAAAAAQRKPNAQGSPPVGSAQVSQVSTSRVNGKVRNTVQLDGTDRRMMRVLGLDPSDKKAAQRYAKEKLGRLRSEQRA